MLKIKVEDRDDIYDKETKSFLLSYNFSISSGDSPVTDAICSCDKPMDNKFFAVSTAF